MHFKFDITIALRGLVILSLVNGKAIYKKYLHRTLKNAKVYASFDITRVFECEMLCKDDDKCKGANFYSYGGRDYSCDLLSEVPSDITESQLNHKKHCKLIVKICEYTMYTGEDMRVHNVNGWRYVSTQCKRVKICEYTM